jgi:hypothetical protein
VLIALVALIWTYRSVMVSLDAERTLGAYYLVLDVLTVYVQQNSAWPANWDDVAVIKPEQRYGFAWPADLDDVRGRIRVDFALQLSEVAAMDPDRFLAVEQVGWNYGPHRGRSERLVNAARRALGGKKRHSLAY